MAARDDSVAATGIRQVTQYAIAEVALVAEGEGEGRTAADEGGAGTADEMDSLICVPLPRVGARRRDDTTFGGGGHQHG
jgi:hypothetical protein